MFEQRRIAWCLATIVTLWGNSALAGIAEDVKALATYEWGQSDAVLKPIDAAVAASLKNEAVRKDLEARLAELLKSKATRAAKHYACQKLVWIGTKESVPALAGLLADPDLSHAARAALEAIPVPSAAAALRDALPNLKGSVKVGVINSLGVGHDPASAKSLVAVLGDADSQVVAAAASALAKIGTAEAVRALFEFHAKAPADLRSAVSVACVEAAESLSRAGVKDEAARRFEELSAPSEPLPIQMAAFRGLLAAQPEQAFPRIVTALQGGDAMRRAVASETIRTMNDPMPYVDVLRTLPPAAQATVLDVLGERKFLPARGAALVALGSPEPSVRTAALRALGRVGAAEDVSRLAEFAAKPEGEGEAARASLARIRAPGSNKAIATAIATATAAKPALLNALATRLAIEELPAIVRCLEDPKPEVRSAAVTAIGALGTEKQIVDLVKSLERTQVANERAGIENSLLAVCGRSGAACSPHLTPLVQSADSGLRVIAVHAIVSCGGSSALASLRSLVEDREETVRDEAVRTVSSWPNKWPNDAAVAEPLLALAKSSQKTSHQVLALRGYLQCVQNDNRLWNEQKAADVLPLVKRAEEKQLAIATIGSFPTAGTLEMLGRFAADPAVAEEACLAVVNLAGRSDLKDVSRELREKALHIAAKNAKTEATKKKAEELLMAIR